MNAIPSSVRPLVYALLPLVLTSSWSGTPAPTLGLSADAGELEVVIDFDTEPGTGQAITGTSPISSTFAAEGVIFEDGLRFAQAQDPAVQITECPSSPNVALANEPTATLSFPGGLASTLSWMSMLARVMRSHKINQEIRLLSHWYLYGRRGVGDAIGMSF